MLQELREAPERPPHSPFDAQPAMTWAAVAQAMPPARTDAIPATATEQLRAAAPRGAAPGSGAAIEESPPEDPQPVARAAASTTRRMPAPIDAPGRWVLPIAARLLAGQAPRARTGSGACRIAPQTGQSGSGTTGS